MTKRISGEGSAPRVEPAINPEISPSNAGSVFPGRPCGGQLEELQAKGMPQAGDGSTPTAKESAPPVPMANPEIASQPLSAFVFSEDFNPPREARIAGYLIVPLAEHHVDMDVAAINSSLEKIKELRGGTWPSGPVDLDDNRRDLIVHQQEFERRTSFTYIILSEDEQTSAGCIYIYPPHHPFDESDKSGMPANADAAISCWVTQAAYDEGLYPKVHHFVGEWLRTDWPFERPYFSSRKP